VLSYARLDETKRTGEVQKVSFFCHLPASMQHIMLHEKQSHKAKKKKQIKYQKQSALSLHGKIKKRGFPAYNGNLEI